MSRRVLPAVYLAAGAMRRMLADQGLGPKSLRGIAANPGMPARDAQLLELMADVCERVDHIQLAEFPSGGLPIYEPTEPSPARIAGDRHGRSHANPPEA